MNAPWSQGPRACVAGVEIATMPHGNMADAPAGLVTMLWASDRIAVNEGGTMSEQHALVGRTLKKASRWSVRGVRCPRPRGR